MIGGINVNEFTLFDTVILCIYMASMVMVGLYFKSRTKTADDFIVADRSLGSSVYIATMVATAVGGGSLVGGVGVAYATGIGRVVNNGVLIFLHVMIGLFLAEKISKQYYGCYTAPDILGKTYGKTSQVIGGICSMIYVLGTGPAMQTIALGNAIHVVTGMQYEIAAILSMSVILFYTFTSGMWGVAMTDYIQFILMAVGLGVAGLASMSKAGGWVSITAVMPPNFLSVKANIPLIIELTMVMALPILIDGNRYARFFAAKTPRIAKTGYLISVLPFAMIYTVTFAMAFAALKIIPGVPQDQVLVRLLIDVLPIGLTGLVISALVAAIMSTADSYLLTASTNLVQDIIRPFKPDLSDKQIVFLTKSAVFGGGLLGMGLALLVPNIMWVWTLASCAYVGGCVVPMMAALFVKGPKSNIAGVSSMILGGGIAVIMHLMKWKIFDQPPILVGTVTCLFVFVLFSYLFPAKPEKSQVA
jgi:SSS family solute:Na+ symporter